jgi:hypothetical protein
VRGLLLEQIEELLLAGEQAKHGSILSRRVADVNAAGPRRVRLTRLDPVATMAP